MILSSHCITTPRSHNGLSLGCNSIDHIDLVVVDRALIAELETDRDPETGVMFPTDVSMRLGV